MCEADKFQLRDARFIRHVETLYGKLAVIVNAVGEKAHNATYPADAAVVAFTPYWTGGCDSQLKSAAVQCELAWEDDQGASFHCNQTFHRGPQACIATLLVAFGSPPPQDRMSIF